MLFPIALTTDWPIYRKHCAVHLNQYTYDLKAIASHKHYLDNFTFSTSSQNSTIFFSICNEIRSDELPDYASDVDLTDAWAIRCENYGDNHTCAPLLYSNDFDWKPLDATNWNRGVIFYALGQPYRINDEIYHTIDLSLKFVYSETEENDDFVYTYSEPIVNQTISIIGTMKTHRIGIKNYNATPSPTPHPFTPDCQYAKRSTIQPNFSMVVDFDKINGGPYGIRKELNISGTKHYMFFQPCERMYCPDGYECIGQDNLSSVWLCESGDIRGHCDSYGLISRSGVLDVDSTNEFPGQFVLRQNGRNTSAGSTQLTVNCDYIAPEDHLFFDDEATLEPSGDQQILKITAKSKEACYIYKDPPNPPIGNKCQTTETDPSGDYINLNLVRYNKIGEGSQHIGWYLSDGQYTGKTDLKNPLIIYEPCGGTTAPADDTEGDIDATVWLCQKENEASERYDSCLAYGKFSNSVSFTNVQPGNLSAGIVANYAGDFHRTAEVTWVCDSYQPKGSLQFDKHVTFDQTTDTLKFKVYAAEACTNHGATWHPIKPTPGPTPSPTPIPWPNPQLAIMEDDQYVMVDLSRLYQSVYSNTMKLGSNDRTKEMTSWNVYYHPWNQIDCPIEDGYRCGGMEQANVWGCWTEDDSSKYCHAIGNKNHGLDMMTINEKNISKGVHIIMEGAYGVNADLVVYCHPDRETNQILFDVDTNSSWVPTSGKYGGQQVRFYLDSALVCPKKYIVPLTPTGPATKTPEPKPYNDNLFFHTPEVEGIASFIYLPNLPQIQQEVLVGSIGKFAKMVIAFNAAEKIDPPEGYDNIGDGKSNVWRCGIFDNGKKMCIPIGDMDCGLEMSLHSENDHVDGIAMKYIGGYNMANSTIIFLCNESLGSDMRFNPVVESWGSTNDFIIKAQTGLACRAPLQHLNATGGGWFLTIVFIGLICYFGVGTIINYAVYDHIALPNLCFWNEVHDSVKSALLFLVTCGSSITTISNSGYDAI